MKHLTRSAIAVCAMLYVPSSHAQASCVAIQPPPVETPAKASRLWGRNSLFWPQHATLRVKFLAGSERQRKAAWQRFAKVDALVNLSFVQVTTGHSDIRVRFDFGKGHWSYVGRGASSIAASQPTMNLGLSAAVIGGDSTEEWDRVATHEMLHAIGFDHEHQHPAHGIPWDPVRVYEYYATTQGWTRAEIDRQVLKRYTGNEFRGTKFDPASIMQYPVPPTLTTNGFSVGWNTKLSRSDINFLQLMYPPKKAK